MRIKSTIILIFLLLLSACGVNDKTRENNTKIQPTDIPEQEDSAVYTVEYTMDDFDECALEGLESIKEEQEDPAFIYEYPDRLSLANPFIYYDVDSEVQDSIFVYPVYDVETKEVCYLVSVSISPFDGEMSFVVSLSVNTLKNVDYVNNQDDMLVYQLDKYILFETKSGFNDGVKSIESNKPFAVTDTEKEFVEMSYGERLNLIKAREKEMLSATVDPNLRDKLNSHSYRLK